MQFLIRAKIARVNNMFKEILLSESSLAFSRKVQNAALAQRKEGVSEALLLGQLERQKLDTIVDILRNSELQAMIEEGQITFGAIKPRAHESKLGVRDDDEAEEKALRLIKPPLQVIFTISIVPLGKDIEIFYSNVKRNFAKQGKIEVWNEFKEYMTSGPVTYFLLHDPEGNAVSEWRRQMGATNPHDADIDSIRGKYAHSIGRNLVHGSSGNTKFEGERNVKKEIKWLHDKMQSIISETDSNVRNLPTEEALREVEVLGEGQELISVKKNSEGQGIGYAISYKDRRGVPRTKYISQHQIEHIDSKINA